MICYYYWDFLFCFMFTDHVTLELRAGKGGNGIIAWRREKYIPKGGPSGGNGGDGAAIILEADEGLFSLESFRNSKLIKAQDGAQGGGACRAGKRGEDLVLKLPVGTLVKDRKGKVIYDFTMPKERFVICKGGKGGKGNVHFKTSTNRAPYQATDGTYGEELEVEFELKLIADVGLVGFPNSGKSTFIAEAASVKVKTAPYPFTTLKPNLGYVISEHGERLLLADIPGIIEGASKNKGLGFEFLRHIERTNLLLYILDAAGTDGRDPLEDLRILQKELRSYNKELVKKDFVVALNKVDLPDAQIYMQEFKKKYKGPLFEISAITGHGVSDLVAFLKRKLNK